MVQMNSLLALLGAAVPVALAHPHVDTDMVAREMAMHREQHVKTSRALSNCASSPHAVALRQRAAHRRAEHVRSMREARGLTNRSLGHQKRDLSSLEHWASFSHNRTGADTTLATPEATLFGSNNTCALVPETTQGPYYVTGELLRSNITEGQAGVPIRFELQFVDVATCAAVPDLVADVWSCNATGVYAGVTGDADFLGLQGGLDSTFLRGVQISDDEGVVTFDSVFPGHYAKRVTHEHLAVVQNYTVLKNGTYVGGTVLHVGQLYFDDALVKAVETNYPYTTNTIAWTTLEEDDYMLDEASAAYDPFVEYVQLTEDVADGLLAWITVGVNTSADYTDDLVAAAHYYSDGGVDAGTFGKRTAEARVVPAPAVMKAA